MRLLLVGAFAYPHSQGSQIYFQEQAIALRAAGAEVELLTYGAGRDPASGEPTLAPEDPSSPATSSGDPERWRALDGFVSTSLPAWATPSSRRSGPRPGKPFADLCLALALRRVAAGSGRRAASWTASCDASKTGPASASWRVEAGPQGASWDASPRATRSPAPGREATPASTRPAFDAILAHHAEAALLALNALPGRRPPVVYCAHTLLEQELPEYFRSPRRAGFGSIAALGRVIDRRISARADAWIALTQSASRVISASSFAPGRRLAPPIPDPVRDPERRDCDAVARAHGLRPGAFFLYSGNLDPYQDLPLLEQVARARRSGALGAAARRPEQGPASGVLPIVLATHDPRAERFAAQATSTGGPGLLVRRMRTAGEARALLGAARASLVPRRTLGGFPIKLANSLAAGIPVVALHGEEWGLVDGRDALIGAVDDPVASITRALERLEQDPDLSARLGAGARATWQAQHDPARVAAETLALVASLRGAG